MADSGLDLSVLSRGEKSHRGTPTRAWPLVSSKKPRRYARRDQPAITIPLVEQALGVALGA
jgi:hypothetical protein